LAILAGIPLEAEINSLRKWAVRLARQQAAFDDMKSPERIGMWAMSGMSGDVIKGFSQATDR
jgi:glutaredoxin-related protein